MHDENGETHVSTDEARAGATPHMTRYILGISLVAIIVLFAIVLMI
ncbi:hypothetical protein [Sphingomonas gilva]|nr:hypothetical protein [Sphingomonas gilva]